MASKKTSKKIFAILTALLMVASIFTSCKADKKEDIDITTQTTTAPSATDNGNVTAQTVQEHTVPLGTYEYVTYEPYMAYEAERIMPDLPETDWEGYTLKILTDEWPLEPEWNSRDIMAEELTGEIINDAVFIRNTALEERYNFTVEQVFAGDNTRDTVRRAVRANDNYFDVASTRIMFSGTLAQEGQFVNLFKVDYLDLEKPWWDQKAVAGISIDKKLYFTSGDCLLVNKDTVAVTLFNKKLIEDFNLEDPYELVRSGQWTIPKFAEMAKDATVDLNGNGRMDRDTDKFGLLSGGVLAAAARCSVGVTVAAKDANDMPFLTFESERTFIAMSTVLAMRMADYNWGAGLSGFNTNPWINENGDNRAELAFMADRGLFLNTQMASVENLRGMESDFGILPMPRIDHIQSDWRHCADEWYGQTLAIPNFHDSDALDRVGFMLEAIAAESRYTTVPAYYDVQLTGKFTRDNESQEMLDIIFNTMVWDTGAVYGWLGYYKTSDTWGPLSYTSVSEYEKRVGWIESAVQKTINDFAKLD